MPGSSRTATPRRASTRTFQTRRTAGARCAVHGALDCSRVQARARSCNENTPACSSKIILNPPPPPVEAAPADDKGAKGGKDAKSKDAKGKGKPAKDAGEDAAPPAQITSIFVPEIEQAVQDFVAKWQERDESMNFAQKYDPDLVKDELRPVVFEEIRQQVDEEMQVLLENLKVCNPLFCALGKPLRACAA